MKYKMSIMIPPRDNKYIRVMALDPCTKGFGFAVMEGGERLVDWGVVRTGAATGEGFLIRVDGLVKRYRPSALVVEDLAPRYRAGRRADRLCALADYVAAWKTALVWVSRDDVRRVLGGSALTRHGIAVAIADAFPELRQHLPPPRKPWMSEDERMHLFDAMSFLVVARAGFASNDGPSLR